MQLLLRRISARDATAITNPPYAPLIPSDVLTEVLTAGESQVLHVVRELGADPQQLLHRRQQLRR